MFPYFKWYLLCVEAYRIYLGIMLYFLYLKIGSKIDCVIYTGMYNFMKVKPVSTFFVVYIDLQCFIIHKSWCVCESVMQLVHKPGASVLLLLSLLLLLTLSLRNIFFWFDGI